MHSAKHLAFCAIVSAAVAVPCAARPFGMVFDHASAPWNAMKDRELRAAEGGSKPRLKSGSETKDVTVETGDTDPDSGDPITETVQKTIYYIEASFGDGFYVKIR